VKAVGGPPVTSAPAPVTLVVQLWAREGASDALTRYEDRVLALLSDHDGELVQRLRGDGERGAPLEFHVIRFANEASLEQYMLDERRVALRGERDVAIARTEVHRVRDVATSRSETLDDATR